MKHESLNGRIYTCDSCRKIHFEFANFAIDLKDMDALREMGNYLRTVLATSVSDDDFDFPYKRSTFIPFYGTNVKLAVTINELQEIIRLINGFFNQQLEIRIPVGHKNIPSKLLNGISYLQLN